MRKLYQKTCPFIPQMQANVNTKIHCLLQLQYFVKQVCNYNFVIADLFIIQSNG